MASFEQRGSSIRVIVRLPGGGKKTSTFDTLTEAKAWAKATEAKVKILGTKAPTHHITNAQLFETFLDAVASKTDSAKFNTLRLMKWCKDPLADLKVAETTTHHINQWIDRSLKNKLSPATVNRELNLMSSAYRYALKSLHWIDINPCHGAARPEKGRARKRPLLTQEELQALCIATGYTQDPKLTTLTARTGASFLLALETGMRSGEVLRLRPKDYNKAQRYIHVSATEKGGRKGAKSGRGAVDPSRDVPLTQRAMDLLEQLLEAMPVMEADPDAASRIHLTS
jgi:integrase